MPSPRPIPIVLRAIVGPLSLYGAACLFLGLYGGFIPAPEWALRVWPFALGLGLINGAAYLAMARFSRPSFAGEPASLFTIGATTLALIWVGSLCVSAGIPLAAALAKGEPTTLSVTVLNLDGSPSAHCPAPIRLKDLLFPFNRFCAPSEALRASTAPGDRLILTGKGTALGLFSETATVTD